LEPLSLQKVVMLLPLFLARGVFTVAFETCFWSACCNWEID